MVAQIRAQFASHTLSSIPTITMEGEVPPAPVEFKGVTYKPLADGKYDAIVVGTGLKESVLAGLLASVNKMKVLIVDRNSYYGGECASLNLTQLYKKFINRNEEPPKAFFDALGTNREYNVDLIPKFIMANGDLVKILVKTDVTRYIEFKLVDGSYVFRKGSGIYKVPATEGEALKTGLVGFFQKQKLHSFLKYIAKYDQANPSTHNGMDLTKATMQACFEKFGLDKDTQEFVGHAMGLMPDDSYLARPAIETVAAVRLYAESLDRYGKSPFIYPLYGLGNLPEGFSRLCAIHGGTFMLNTNVDEILFNDDGSVAGVRSGSGDEAMVALAPLVIADPSYVPADMVRKTGRVIRSICCINAPIKGLEVPNSAQIIIPQSQVGRRNDVYVSVVGSTHQVAAKDKYIAIVSTTVETAKPADEVAAGVALLPAGSLITKFDNIVDTYEPVNDSAKSRLFITKSYDASSHFESATVEVLDVYRRITGSPLDLSAPAEVATE